MGFRHVQGAAGSEAMWCQAFRGSDTVCIITGLVKVSVRWNALDTNTARDQFADVLARVQSQMADIAAVQKHQAALRISAEAADQTVEVTVNAQGQLLKVVIDESYLNDHDIEDLGEAILEAARAATQQARQRVAELLAPIGERQKLLPSFSDLVEGAPNIGDFMPDGHDWSGLADTRKQDGRASELPGLNGGDPEEGPELTVRR
jgi:DNA-binding protein YbaB